MTKRCSPVRCFFSVLLLVAMAAATAHAADRGAATPNSPAGESLPDRIIFTQLPAQVDHHRPLEDRALSGGGLLADGSRIVVLDGSGPDPQVTVLTEGFSAAGSADLSFDAERILFVGRRASPDPFDVWEMNVDGSAVRQITRNVGDCVEAIYLSTLYTIDRDESLRQIAFCSAPPDGGAAALYTCDLDGERIRQITFNPQGATDPYLLSDGRLLFSSWRLPGGGPDAAPGSALFTVNTDGTDVFVFAAAHESPAVRGMPCETPDGWVVYVESMPPGRDRGGSLVAVRRTRSLRTRRVVAGDDGGSFRSPSAMSDGRLVVSYRRRGVSSYGIVVLDPAGASGVSPLYDAPQWHDVDAVVVSPRPPPAGRSSVVDERQSTGMLYCLDTYLTDTRRIAPEGDAKIEHVQVFRALAGGASAGGSGASPVTASEQLLGTAPVEVDGSFYLEVPARMPLRLQTLNGRGDVVQAMDSWMWVMPREGRGCVGCHEDRELTPPNRHAFALRKPPYPVGVEGASTGARRDAGGHGP